MYSEKKITKVMRVGTIPVYGTRRASVYIRVEFSDQNRLSITGVIGPLPSGDALGGCGQIDMEFDHRDKSQNDSRYHNPTPVSDFNFAPGWNADLWYGLLNVWHNWHLNDMNAACEHQQIMGITYSLNSKHVCPVCGYKIGSAWKSRDIPQSVIEFLCALPDADKKPAWV